MHVMEGECEKSSEMVAESAPDLTESIKLSKEEAQPVTLTEPVVPALPEPAVDSPYVPEVEKIPADPVVNGKVETCEKSDSCESAEVKEDECADSEKREEEENRTKPEEKEKEEAKEPVKEAEVTDVKEVGSGGCSEEEDRNSVTSSQSRKRAALVEAEVEGEGEGSSSESDAGGAKRPRLEADDGEDERERLVREYVEECSESMEDMSRAADKLQREIGALGELLRSKELEWNSILRLRKLKEEMLERLLRRRRLSAILSGQVVKEDCSEYPANNKSSKTSHTNNVNSLPNNNGHHVPHSNSSNTNGGLMMVPIVSSSPGPGQMTSFSRGPRIMEPQPPPRGFRMQRPILPKPPIPAMADQNSIVGEGRQGAILDVKSIIADYRRVGSRSRHPEHVPRRGRRMRPNDGGPRPAMEPPVVSSTRISGSPALMSMANMALGSGSHVRENPPGPNFIGQDNSRPSSADSSRSGHGHLEMLPAPGLSFKDALVQFAKMSQPPKPPPPPPPYPEVTLHPVPAPHSPPPTHTSLLHGILTKTAPPPNPPAPPPPQPPHPHRATTFSPTLARLLTAPERTNTNHNNSTSHFRPPASRVNISEILSSSKKNRNEITITPVSAANKTKDDVVMLADEEEETDGDRLVIDESRDAAELPESVPQCQGCHQRAAQFVCAGCGNQWYCSRECQVSAWEEHSEMCSG